MASIWLTTDVGPHLIDSTIFLENQIDWLVKDDRAWPWVTIGIVGVVQAACVLFLDERETVSVSSLTDKSAKSVWGQLKQESNEGTSRRKLLPPIDLFKKVRKTGEVIIDEQAMVCFQDIVTFRNDYIHFTPKSHSLLLDGVPLSGASSISSAQKILTAKGMLADNRINASDRDEIIRKLENGKTTLESLQEIYTHRSAIHP